jgi:hypothetical protein
VREAELRKARAIVIALTGVVVLCSQSPVSVDARQTALQRVSGVRADRLDSKPAAASMILFRGEPLATTTFVAKVPAPPAPAQGRRSEEPPAAPAKRAIGCEAAVSPLVKPQAVAIPGRCLA